MICDRCWQGRHLRCHGKGGCSCTVCIPTTRSMGKKKHDPIADYKRKIEKVKASKLPTPNVTTDDILTTIRVLNELPSILDHAVCRAGTNFDRLGRELGMSETIVRNVVRGRSKQGMTTMSLLNVLPWAAEALK